MSTTSIVAEQAHIYMGVWCEMLLKERPASSSISHLVGLASGARLLAASQQVFSSEESARYSARIDAARLLAELECWPTLAIADINVSFEYPPIPDRQFDFCATRDGYEPGAPVGWGRTRQVAIDDLLEREAELADERAERAAA